MNGDTRFYSVDERSDDCRVKAMVEATGKERHPERISCSERMRQHHVSQSYTTGILSWKCNNYPNKSAMRSFGIDDDQI
jgi:hypothetical protein